MVSAAPEPFVPGDFTLDDVVDVDDLHILCGAIQAGATHSAFDLDNSGGVATLDDMEMLLNALGSMSADSNLDGRVDAIDLNQVGINWQQSGDFGWSDGDFTCNGRVDSADLNEVGMHWRFGVAARAKAPRVPRAPLASGRTVVQADLAIAGTRDEVKRIASTESYTPMESDLTDEIHRATRRRADRLTRQRRSQMDSSESRAAEKILDELFKRIDFL